MRYLIALIFTTFTLTANTQMLSYADALVEYDGQMVSTINVTLDPKPEQVRNSFESWMDDNYDVDLNGRTLLFFERDVMKAQGVVIPLVSDRRIDLMVMVDENSDKATNLHVFASFGYDNWITLERYPAEFVALENIVYEYVSTYLPEYYQEKVSEAEEVLIDLKDDRMDLKEEVEENKEEIEELMQENEDLMMKLRDNQKKISLHKSKLNSRSDDYKIMKKRVGSNK